MSSLSSQQLQEQLAASHRASEKLYNQLTAKEDAEAAQDAADVRTASMVLSAMSKIPVPKDGKDGKDAEVDYDTLQTYINEAVDAIPKAKDGKDGYIPMKGIDYVDGEDAVVDYDALNKYISKKVGEIPAPADGKDAYVPVKGKDYYDGADGYTPIKDVDYFDGKDAITPVKGVDYFDGDKGEVGPQGPAGITEKVDYTRVEAKITTEVRLAATKLGATLATKVTTGIAPISYEVDKLTVELGKMTNRLDAIPKVKEVVPPKVIQPKPVKGKEGARGKKGDAGVGIKDITTFGDSFTLELTDGSKRSINMPNRSTIAAPVQTTAIQRASRVPYDGKASGVDVSNVQDAVDMAINPFKRGSAARFMREFNKVDGTHSSRFVYNSSDQLINIQVVDDLNEILYLVDFTYVTGSLVSKLITELTTGNNVEIIFTYDDDDLLISKDLVYSN